MSGYHWKAQSKLYKVKFVFKGLDEPKQYKNKTVINLINRRSPDVVDAQ